MAHVLALCRAIPIGSAKALITLRSAQVRRISWVRGVRPVRERCEWPPQEAAPGRPLILARVHSYPLTSLTAWGACKAAPRVPRLRAPAQREGFGPEELPPIP